MQSDPTPTVSIVPFEEAYQAQVIDLVLYVQNVEYGIGLPLEEQPDLVDIPEVYTYTRGGFWVAINTENFVVGTIGLQAIESGEGVGWGLLKKFFVRKDYRGHASGAAAKLYETLIAQARAAHLKGIVLDTPRVAERSHAFYRRVGFREIARKELPFDYPYADRDSLLFLLDLPANA